MSATGAILWISQATRFAASASDEIGHVIGEEAHERLHSQAGDLIYKSNPAPLR